MSDLARRYPGAILLSALLFAAAVGCGKKATDEPDLDVDEDITKVVSHRIMEGESLRGIADDFYGDPERAEEIARYNNMSPSDPLLPGDLIQVPLTIVDISSVRERKKARRPYNQGLDLAARRQWVDAAAKFKEALDLDPELYDARYNLALTYQKMGYHDRALMELLGLPKEQRETKRVYFAKGNSYFYLEQYEDAVTAFRSAIEIDPEFAKAQYSLASCYEKLEKTDEAIEAWRRYLEIDSTGEWAEEARRNLARLTEQ